MATSNESRLKEELAAIEAELTDSLQCGEKLRKSMNSKMAALSAAGPKPSRLCSSR